MQLCVEIGYLLKMINIINKILNVSHFFYQYLQVILVENILYCIVLKGEIGVKKI